MHDAPGPFSLRTYARIATQVYAVLPAAAMFMVGYNWLSNHVGSRALFHLTITPFFAFYALFAFVMYPMRGVLHHAAGNLCIF